MFLVVNQTPVGFQSALSKIHGRWSAGHGWNYSVAALTAPPRNQTLCG